MSWIAITVDTLHEAKVAKVINAASSRAKAAGQDDRAPGVIQGVVDTIRRKVGSHPGNRVDADEARIPKGLRDLAVDMIIARLKMAVGMDLTEDERRTLDRAEADLNRIADGKDAVDEPDSPVEAPVESGVGIEEVAPGAGKNTAPRMEGL